MRPSLLTQVQIALVCIGRRHALAFWHFGPAAHLHTCSNTQIKPLIVVPTSSVEHYRAKWSKLGEQGTANRGLWYTMLHKNEWELKSLPSIFNPSMAVDVFWSHVLAIMSCMRPPTSRQKVRGLAQDIGPPPRIVVSPKPANNESLMVWEYWRHAGHEQGPTQNIICWRSQG